jgi:hypothetical protein
MPPLLQSEVALQFRDAQEELLSSGALLTQLSANNLQLNQGYLSH